MREIKFRAWDKEAQQYYQPAFILGDDIWVALDNNKQFELDCIGAIYGDILVIEQFTGLHDKNGKEIYEGDIVKHKTSPREVVVFEDGCYRFKDSAHTLMNRIETVEVIGNIHEGVNKDV